MKGIVLWNMKLMYKLSFLWLVMLIYTALIAFAYTYNGNDYTLKCMTIAFIVANNIGLAAAIRKNKFLGILPCTREKLVMSVGVCAAANTALFILPIPVISAILGLFVGRTEIQWLRMAAELAIMYGFSIILSVAGIFMIFSDKKGNASRRKSVIIALIPLIIPWVFLGDFHSVNETFNSLSFAGLCAAFLVGAIALSWLILYSAAKISKKHDF